MSEFTFTDANFEVDVLKSDKPVLVDFFAEWCGPCKMQGPIIDEVAKEAGDNVKVGKMDVDANSQTAEKFDIMSIPTLVIFKGGVPIETMNGLQSKEALLEKLKRLI